MSSPGRSPDSSEGSAGSNARAADALVRQGAFDRALDEYAVVIRLDPQSSAGYLGRGVIYSKMREFKRAIADYTEAIRLDPRSAPAYRNRGRDLLVTGAVKRAITDFTSAVQLEPNDHQAYCDRATAYNRIARHRAALADANEAIRLAPDFYLGHDARGWAYFGLARAAVFTFWRKGNAARRKADFEHAIADFTEAIRLNPNAADCYHGRSQAFIALGDRENAARDARRVPNLRR